MGMIFLGGCCRDRSLIKYDTSSDRIDQIVREQLNGLDSDKERLEKAASMVDWRMARIGSNRIAEVPLLRWKEDGNTLLLPVHTACWLGVGFSNDEIAVVFDESGQVISSAKQFREFTRDYNLKLMEFPEGFVDPWEVESPQMGRPSVKLESMHGHPATWSIKSDYPEANRIIQVDYISYANDPDELEGSIKISLDPPIEYVLVDQTEPIIEKSVFAGSLFVDEPEFFERSGKMRIESSFSEDRVPDYRVYYRCLAVLAPHNGVALTAGLDSYQERTR